MTLLQFYARMGQKKTKKQTAPGWADVFQSFPPNEPKLKLMWLVCGAHRRRQASAKNPTRVPLTISFVRFQTFSRSGTGRRRKELKAPGTPEIRAEAVVVVGMSECAAVEPL